MEVNIKGRYAKSAVAKEISALDDTGRGKNYLQKNLGKHFAEKRSNIDEEQAVAFYLYHTYICSYIYIWNKLCADLCKFVKRSYVDLRFFSSQAVNVILPIPFANN